MLSAIEMKFALKMLEAIVEKLAIIVLGIVVEEGGGSIETSMAVALALDTIVTFSFS